MNEQTDQVKDKFDYGCFFCLKTIPQAFNIKHYSIHRLQMQRLRRSSKPTKTSENWQDKQ